MKKIYSTVILRVIQFLIGATLFVVPIIFIPVGLSYFTTTKTFFFIFFVEIISFLYLWLVLFYPEYRPKRNYILYCFLLFVLANIVSGILGIFPTFSFWSSSLRADGLVLLIHVFMFFLVVASVVKSRRVLNILLGVSILSSICVALSVYLGPILVNITHLFSIDEFRGGLANNDSFAGIYLVFNLFFIIYLFFETQKRTNRYLLGTSFALIVFSPIFFNFNIFQGLVSFSDLVNNPMLLIGTARGAFISLVLGIIFTTLLFFVNHHKKSIRIGLRISAGVFFLSLMIILMLLFIPGNSVSKWFGEKTGGFRFLYWHQAVEGFKERPILGWGPGNFRTVNAKYFDSAIFNNSYQGTETSSDKAHNIILDTAVNSGIFGLLMYLSIFLSSLILLWSSRAISNHARAVFSGLFLAYFLNNLIFFDVLLSYMMFALLLASITIIDNTSEMLNNYEEISENKFLKNKIFITVIPILLVTVGIISVRYFALLPFKKIQMNDRFYTLPPEIRGPLFKDKPNISDFGNSEDKEVYASLVLEQYKSNIDIIKKQKDLAPFIMDIDGMISDILKSYGPYRKTLLEMSTIYSLYDIKYQLTSNDSLTLNKMKEYSKEEIGLSPKDPRGYMDFAHTFFYEKRYTEALFILERAYALSPLNQILNKLIIDIARETGDKKLFEEKLKRAETNIPGVNFR